MFEIFRPRPGPEYVCAGAQDGQGPQPTRGRRVGPAEADHPQQAREQPAQPEDFSVGGRDPVGPPAPEGIARQGGEEGEPAGEQDAAVGPEQEDGAAAAANPEAEDGGGEEALA